MLQDRRLQNSFHLCPKFYETFMLLGQKWNGIIIEALICKEPLRFRDISRIIEKCSDRVLVERLRKLERAGIVQRAVSSSIRYSLTPKGRELKPIMQLIHQWSDKWCHCGKS